MPELTLLCFVAVPDLLPYFRPGQVLPQTAALAHRQ